MLVEILASKYKPAKSGSLVVPKHCRFYHLLNEIDIFMRSMRHEHTEFTDKHFPELPNQRIGGIPGFRTFEYAILQSL